MSTYLNKSIQLFGAAFVPSLWVFQSSKSSRRSEKPSRDGPRAARRQFLGLRGQPRLSRTSLLSMTKSEHTNDSDKSGPIAVEQTSAMQSAKAWQSKVFLERMLAQAPAKTSSSGCCTALRGAALIRLENAAREKRLPHRKLETWRFTDISELLDTSFKVSVPSEKATAEQVGLARQSLANANSTCGRPAGAAGAEPLRFVFLNGQLIAELSSNSQTETSGLPSGAFANNLSACNDPVLQERLVSVIRDAPPEAGLGVVPFREEPKTLDYTSGIGKVNDFFSLLNAYLGMSANGDGIFVLYLPPGSVADRMIEIIQMVDAGTAAHPRVILYLDKGAMASVSLRCVPLEQGLAADAAPKTAMLLNECINVHLEPESSLKLNVLGSQGVSETIPQEKHRFYHMTGMSVRCQRGASFSIVNVNADSLALRRMVMGVDLCGRQASCHFNGLTLLQNRALGDVQVRIGHHVPECESRQLQKNLVIDRSAAIYKGTVYVEREADGTDAHQLIRSLVLSDRSRVHVMPFLEVLNDEVSCTHGAASAHLDESELFYIQTRGASAEEARMMLMNGFIGEITEQLAYPELERWIFDTQLRGIALRASSRWRSDNSD